MPKRKYYIILKLWQERGGFAHILRRLIAGIKMAALSRRTFIVPPHFSFVRKHNANIPTHKQLPDYLSLDKTQIVVDGKPQTFSYIRFDELSKKEVATWTSRRLFSPWHFDADDPADLLVYVDGNLEEAQKNIRCLAGSHRAPLGKAARREFSAKVRLKLFPRQEYWQLAQETAQALGGAGNYYAMHVRRGDRARQEGSVHDKATRPKAIIKRIRRWVPAGETLYLMSDEPKRHFFDPLKKHWRLARHWDFPQLDQFVNQPNPLLVDNYALFLIEALICRQAKLNISTYQNHMGEFRHFFELCPPIEINKNRHCLFFRKTRPSLKKRRGDQA